MYVFNNNNYCFSINYVGTCKVARVVNVYLPRGKKLPSIKVKKIKFYLYWFQLIWKLNIILEMFYTEFIIQTVKDNYKKNI